MKESREQTPISASNHSTGSWFPTNLNFILLYFLNFITIRNSVSKYICICSPRKIISKIEIKTSKREIEINKELNKKKNNKRFRAFHKKN